MAGVREGLPRRHDRVPGCSAAWRRADSGFDWRSLGTRFFGQVLFKRQRPLTRTSSLPANQQATVPPNGRGEEVSGLVNRGFRIRGAVGGDQHLPRLAGTRRNLWLCRPQVVRSTW